MSTRLSEKDYTKTSELAIAATLIYFGYPLDHLEPIDNQRLNFVFLREHGYEATIDKLIQRFWLDELSVSPKRFFYILKELKSRVFAERREA